MNEDSQKIYTALPPKRADLVLLILASQGIKARSESKNSRYDILVFPAQADMAIKAVEIHDAENRFFGIRLPTDPATLSSFSSPGAFVIMGILCLVHFAGLHFNIHDRMVMAGGASGLYILQGDTYRAITALFLHADGRHLLGNLAGMLIFGAPFIRLSGFGAGPFILLFAGTLGNLMAAGLYRNAQLSIGASTAVMAAAGLLCAFQSLEKRRGQRLRAILPIFTGGLLVGMFSQGERTDVWAHIFGFVAGLGSGFFFFPLNRVLRFPGKDTIALCITICIILSALVAASAGF